MKLRHAAQCLGFAAASLLLTSSVSADEPFAVEVVDAALEVPLGFPVMAVARIANISGTQQPAAFLHASLRLKVVDGPPDAMQCLATSPFEGPQTSHDIAGVADLVANRRAEVPAGWTTEVPRGFLPPESGEYTVVFKFSMTAGTETRLGEPEDNWVGEVSSAPVKVRVIEPQGVDAEAFEWYSNLVPEDYCCSRTRRFISAFGIPLEKAERADLLHRFPDSVYTAEYVMNYLLQRGVDYVPPEIVRWRLKKPIGDFHARVPCPPPERCSDDGTTYLGGADYISWKLAWCERILERHPDVWFADEVLYWKAIYSCRLGDTAGCAADLKELAEHGRPYAAEKATGLITDLEAAGILGEKAQ